MKNILICDDEVDIVQALQIYLGQSDYRVFPAYNGEEALSILRKEEIHLVLLDLMMPVMDGMTTMRAIREFSNVPIILLTAKSEDTDIILGLNLGADDYITKPFSPLEVVARVNSQIRRYTTLGAEEPRPDVIQVGGIEVRDKLKKVFVDGEEVPFTPKEYEILMIFMKSPGQVFSPREIYKLVWKETPTYGSENTVAVHIRHIREKIEITPTEPRYLKVVFGQGYKLEKGRNVE